jgi:dinuclear metal center YbgI/SA1388 family protein
MSAGAAGDRLHSDGDGAPLADVVAYLDRYLRIGEVPDEANAVNGLQVENAGRVHRIVAAVDASLETIEHVPSRHGGVGASGDELGGSPLLLVHHGLLWDGNVPLTGRRMRRVRTLLDNDIALYAAHIPLDLHPDVGNNAVLARRLGLAAPAPFGRYRGTTIGVRGDLDIGRDELVRKLDALLETRSRIIPGGPERCARIGIVTGAAGNLLAEAREAGLDTFVTGEGPHHSYFDAMEWGINLIYAGHYATEQVGVQALAEHLGLRFELPWEFHWHPTGM